MTSITDYVEKNGIRYICLPQTTGKPGKKIFSAIENDLVPGST